MTRLTLTATIEHELIHFDGPQLLLLKTNQKRKALAVAIEKEGFVQPFFCCEISDGYLEKYFSGHGDLLFALSHAHNKAYYFFDLDASESGDVALARCSDKERRNEDYWPERGVFVRTHTSNVNPYKPPRVGTISKRTFAIDGRWGTTDFARFHNKTADLYFLYGSFEAAEKTKDPIVKSDIIAAITDHAFKGGGSYVALYGGLQTKARAVHPLDIDKIQYASPGEVVLKGNGKILDEISGLRKVFETRHQDVKTLYTDIRKILRGEKLLAAKKDTPFASTGNQDAVLKKSLELAALLGFKNPRASYEICGKNVLIFSKVLLSAYRRAEMLFEFYDEGRVQESE